MISWWGVESDNRRGTCRLLYDIRRAGENTKSNTNDDFSLINLLEPSPSMDHFNWCDDKLTLM